MKTQRIILQHKNQIAIASGILIAVAFAAKWLAHWQLGWQVAMVTASIIGFLPIAIQAYQALRVKVVSIELLVTIAVLGAFVIGEYNESAIVTFLFLFGALLEQKTLEKTRSAISQLTKMAPASALLLDEAGTIEKVDIDEVVAGDLLLVKTGAQVPVDGVISEGRGHLNEASVTGEAQMAAKSVGDKVFAGTILENGTLKVTAEKVGEDTTFGKIIELVEEAQDAKSNAEGVIDKFAKYYTPAVLLLALVVGVVTQDLRLAITILVLGCPGALVIGVPVSSVAGIGNGAKNGILIKGGQVLDTFSQVDTFVFDKTGTLTEGKPTVAVVRSYNHSLSEEKLLMLTAAVERESDHPLGQAITRYAALENYPAVTETKVIKGQGLMASVTGYQLLVGNEKLLQAGNVQLSAALQKELSQLQREGNSTVLIAVDGQLALLIGIKDQIRKEAASTLQQLRKMGAKQLVMLTGDNQAAADLVGQQLALNTVKGGLLPEEKSAYVRQLQASGHKVAFVGDGVNDSPSIALADIGIAMGNGTDVAVETSDIVLMQSNFANLVQGYGLTKKTVANMKENIAIAVGTVLFLLIGLVAGYIYMASGMLVHELSILVVVINGMRLLGYRTKHDQVTVSEKDLTATLLE
ncbi:heavy metal translocating P-type ATPase [Candidatus Enterococcus leclercqii]|uniref:heavy metal translocating P-type ATPase n=1 Tax=Candidatus Enterococcus leclercqii TaxID=1857218 RepID=UPI00137A64AF|nr:heavy metal translocating P-type ATPase [Enterococcus sp. CU9D]KAF1291290.1 copper-translocating P-type ATPase [Enterococcus sp. CU9D]